MKEYILSAANYYNDEIEHQHQPKNIKIGFVICGRRHHNCIGTFTQISDFPRNDFWTKVDHSEIQGFITNTDRFVNRKEAYDIAFEYDQIIGSNKDYATNSIGLTSEDLY